MKGKVRHASGASLGNMKKIVPFLFVFVSTFMGCDDQKDPDPIPDTPQVLFHSGFEADTFIDPVRDSYQVIRGRDAETSFSWPIGILGSNFGGIHRINDDGGAAIDNYLDNVVGPQGNETTALFQRVNYDVEVTQTPYQINNVKANPKELSMRYWMKIDDNSVMGPDKWRALWEYKTKRYNLSSTDGFRMIAFIATDDNGIPYWLLQGDRNPAEPIWQVRNYQVPIPREEWFKVEYLIRWGEGSDGYAAMKVNGQLIAEHNGATTANGDDLDFIILTQVYGNTHPMHQWIDDIEIFNYFPED